MNTAETKHQISVNPAITLIQSAHQTPNHLSVVDSQTENTTTYTVLESALISYNLAAELLNSGIQPGESLALHAPNSAWHLFFFAACARIGAIFVPLNWRIPATQADLLAKNIGCRRLFTPDSLAELRTLALDAQKTTLTQLDQLDAELPACPPDDAPILGMLTSGTTANPKQVQLNSSQVFWAWQNFRDGFRYSSADTVLVAAPLSHIGGLNGTTNDVFVGGGTVVIEPDFNPQRLLRRIEQYRVNQMFGVPTMYRALTQAPNWNSADLSSWRNALIGGDTPSVELLRALTARGLHTINVFGMTETGGAGFCAHTDHALTGTGMVGFPFRFVSARVLCAEDEGVLRPEVPLRDCPVGQSGMLALRGPGVIDRYVSDEHTAAGIVEGWLITGDIGCRDELGRYRILGRAADRIISGGENINPAEVEAALRTLPVFADCLVVGVPDEVWGEAVTVMTVLPDSSPLPESSTRNSDLLALAREATEAAGLPRFAWPKQVVFVPALPLNQNGKPDRTAARALAIEKSAS